MKFIVALLLILPAMALAQSSTAVKLAHDRGFTGCDAGIEEAFSLATTGEVSVVATWFDETAKDALKLTAVYGRAGDSIITESEFRKKGKQCLWTQTSIVINDKNCVAYKEEMDMFKFTEQTADIVRTTNPGGVTLYLKPVGEACMAVFQRGGIN